MLVNIKKTNDSKIIFSDISKNKIEQDLWNMEQAYLQFKVENKYGFDNSP